MEVFVELSAQYLLNTRTSSSFAELPELYIFVIIISLRPEQINFTSLFPRAYAEDKTEDIYIFFLWQRFNAQEKLQ